MRGRGFLVDAGSDSRAPSCGGRGRGRAVRFARRPGPRTGRRRGTRAGAGFHVSDRHRWFGRTRHHDAVHRSGSPRAHRSRPCARSAHARVRRALHGARPRRHVLRAFEHALVGPRRKGHRAGHSLPRGHHPRNRPRRAAQRRPSVRRRNETRAHHGRGDERAVRGAFARSARGGVGIGDGSAFGG